MSKATYWQRGEALDYKNTTDKLIEAGEIITFGSRIGIAGTTIPPGEKGTIHVEGTYKMPKKSGESITIGTAVFYTEGSITAGPLAADGSTGVENGTSIGYAAESATNEQDTILVKILG